MMSRMSRAQKHMTGDSYFGTSDRFCRDVLDFLAQHSTSVIIRIDENDQMFHVTLVRDGDSDTHRDEYLHEALASAALSIPHTVEASE